MNKQTVWSADPERATPPLCLQYWEKRTPDRVYLTQPVARDQVIDYTWREVGDQVRRMSAYLLSLKLPPHSQIALLGKNSAHWIMADLAIWMAGHVSIPLYFTLNAESAAYILYHCEAKLLFVGKMDDLWAGVAPGIPDHLPCITLPLAPRLDALGWDEIIARTEPLTVAEVRSPDELATVIYTSGSTGQPKGVMTSFGAMIEVAHRANQLFPIGPSDRALSYLPLAHAAERSLLEMPSLYHGIHVYFAWSLETFVADLRRARPTLFFSVPRLWTKFNQGITEKLPIRRQKLLFNLPIISGIVRRRILRELGLQDVRIAITGSAPLAPALVVWYRQLGLELLEGYGMSENFAYSHINLPGDTRIGYVGKPCPGVEQRIDSNWEVLVRSPSSMMGYFKDEARSAESFTDDGYFRTGDMGELDAKGRLKITGRVKELFKTSKGKYIAPVPIENLIAAHPAVEAVCVTGVGLPQPVGLIMLAPGVVTDRNLIAAEFDALLKLINGRVEAHEQLDYLVLISEPWTIENGFLTPTMKIRRNVIEHRYGARLEKWSRSKEKVLFE